MPLIEKACKTFISQFNEAHVSGIGKASSDCEIAVRLGPAACQ
jgi:hypothetical protein